MQKVTHDTTVSITINAIPARYFFMFNYQPFIEYQITIHPIKKRVKLFKTTMTPMFSARSA